MRPCASACATPTNKKRTRKGSQKTVSILFSCFLFIRGARSAEGGKGRTDRFGFLQGWNICARSMDASGGVPRGRLWSASFRFLGAFGGERPGFIAHPSLLDHGFRTHRHRGESPRSRCRSTDPVSTVPMAMLFRSLVGSRVRPSRKKPRLPLYLSLLRLHRARPSGRGRVAVPCASRYLHSVVHRGHPLGSLLSDCAPSPRHGGWE